MCRTVMSGECGRTLAVPRRYPCDVRFNLIPREERFFDMFEEDVTNVLSAARLFEAMLRTYDSPEERAREIRELEHRGDVRHAVRPRGHPCAHQRPG